MKLSARVLTAAFVLSEAILLVLILANVVVADSVRWIFFAIVFAYVVGMIVFGRKSRSRNSE